MANADISVVTLFINVDGVVADDAVAVAFASGTPTDILRVL